MGHTAGAMVASKHPDARAVAAKQQLIQQQMRTLQRLATLRQQRLMESMYRHEYFLESAELEQWIREQVQSAGSEDYGQDYEHLLVSVWVNTCSGEHWPTILSGFCVQGYELTSIEMVSRKIFLSSEV
jgi:FMN phosphatase YigB (HAD superfamily)